MKLKLTEEQIDRILKEFDSEEPEEQEKLSERHYDEFVRLFHRLKEWKDIGIIQEEEYQKIQLPMFEILVRMRDEIKYLYGSNFSVSDKND